MGSLNYNAIIRIIITTLKMPLTTLTPTITVVIMADMFTALTLCPKCFTYINLPNLPTTI